MDKIQLSLSEGGQQRKAHLCMKRAVVSKGLPATHVGTTNLVGKEQKHNGHLHKTVSPASFLTCFFIRDPE